MREKTIALAALCALIILSPAAYGGEDFLSKYWGRPVPFQNHSNKFFLYPEECAKCHEEQYDKWKGSLHSKAVSPGLLGQINPHKDPEFAMSCYFCHAPMEEQAEMRKGSRVQGFKGSRGKSEIQENPFFDNNLKLSGVSCSVCHLRDGKVYGPPKKGQGSRVQGSKGPREKSEIRNPKSEIAHNDFIEKAFFEKAEFCAACHQMDEGYELNGKILTNTYKEWKESIYAKNNITCQNCHMPDRQHLWRGIHDIEMVKKGVSIDAIREAENAKLVITNSSVGHYFPTYATPLVVIKGFMLDKKGGIIPSSVREAYVGRYVSLDLSEEFYDTRIAPQKTFEFDYAIDKSYNKNSLVFEVWVYPDEFYNRFYKEALNNPGSDTKKDKIKKALEITEKSHYLLYKSEMRSQK